MLEQTGKAAGTHKVGVDDTPISSHMESILESIGRADGEEQFEDVFANRTRAEMIGLFLALLELIRQRRIRAVQDNSFGQIQIRLITDEERRALEESWSRDESKRPIDSAPFAAAMSEDEPFATSADEEPIGPTFTDEGQSDDNTTLAETANGEVRTSEPTDAAVDADMADPAEAVANPSISDADEASCSEQEPSGVTRDEDMRSSPNAESTDVEHTHDTQ